MWQVKSRHAYEMVVEELRETPLWDRFFSIVEILAGVENAMHGITIARRFPLESKGAAMNITGTTILITGETMAILKNSPEMNERSLCVLWSGEITMHSFVDTTKDRSPLSRRDDRYLTRNQRMPAQECWSCPRTSGSRAVKSHVWPKEGQIWGTLGSW